MRIIAHRGHHRAAPENTLAAFQAAADLGVDGVETDVRLCACGALVLHHDACAPDGSPVASLSLAQLQDRLPFPVPTLAEALASFPDLLWDLEIKDPAALTPTVQQLAMERAPGERLLTCFGHEVLLGAAPHLPAPAGLLLGHRPTREQLPWRQHLPPAVQVLVWHHELLDAGLVAEARQHRLATWAFGVEGTAHHRRCCELGVDALVTDHPDLEPSSA